MAKKKTSPATRSKAAQKRTRPKRAAKATAKARRSTPSGAAPRKVKKATPKPVAAAAPRKARKAKKPVSLEADISRMDQEILKLINKRAAATTALIQQSENPNKSLFDPSGDELLWNTLKAENSGPLPWHTVRTVFRSIVTSARQQVRQQRVAYLGPPFSFTHMAAIEQFGESAQLIPVSTIASVFEEVNRGHAEYGIVPIENSTDGRVVDTLAMFTRLPLRICGEVQLNIHHYLLANCPRSEIVEVYSKPQALSQCRDWLAKNMPQARLHDVTSTSTAAQLARDKHGAAAVAGRRAAVEYGLQIVAERIQDNRNNITRFAIIGEDLAAPTGKDRTAILLQISHRPGSLADSLVAFKKNRINLTWIESFPLRGPEMGYLFFLDFEGHVKESKVKKTLAELGQKAVRIEILGSYPRSEPIA